MSMSHTRQFKGLLQPGSSRSSGKDPDSFRLVSQGKSYRLKVPTSMKPFLQKHLWESFFIRGQLLKNHLIEVKRARMEEESNEVEHQDVLEEVDHMEDMTLYEHQIHQGFNIEPGVTTEE